MMNGGGRGGFVLGTSVEATISAREFALNKLMQGIPESEIVESVEKNYKELNVEQAWDAVAEAYKLKLVNEAARMIGRGIPESAILKYLNHHKKGELDIGYLYEMAKGRAHFRGEAASPRPSSSLRSEKFMLAQSKLQGNLNPDSLNSQTISIVKRERAKEYAKSKLQQGISPDQVMAEIEEMFRLDHEQALSVKEQVESDIAYEEEQERIMREKRREMDLQEGLVSNAKGMLEQGYTRSQVLIHLRERIGDHQELLHAEHILGLAVMRAFKEPNVKPFNGACWLLDQGMEEPQIERLIKESLPLASPSTPADQFDVVTKAIVGNAIQHMQFVIREAIGMLHDGKEKSKVEKWIDSMFSDPDPAMVRSILAKATNVSTPMSQDYKLAKVCQMLALDLSDEDVIARNPSFSIEPHLFYDARGHIDHLKRLFSRSYNPDLEQSERYEAKRDLIEWLKNMAVSLLKRNEPVENVKIFVEKMIEADWVPSIIADALAIARDPYHLTA